MVVILEEIQESVNITAEASGNTNTSIYIIVVLNNIALPRRVEESRGNRVGNSAFYRDQNSNRTFMNLENQIQGSSLHSFMSYISKDAFRDKKVIDNYLVHFNNGSYDVYYAVASGSRRLAKSLLAHVNSTERSTFNHLHDEVLKVII